MTAVDALTEAGRMGISLRLAEDGKIKVQGKPDDIPPSLLVRLRRHRDEIAALLAGNACCHCGGWLDWSMPCVVAFGDGTAAHLACYERVERTHQASCWTRAGGLGSGCQERLAGSLRQAISTKAEVP
ncbi:MAG: hypothetical protein WAS21_01730 [Geminicoccaceae bacterium]